MSLLLKDCGLAGFKGSVQYCAECACPTVHFKQSGYWPVCGMCGAFSSLKLVISPPEQAIEVGAKPMLPPPLPFLLPRMIQR